MTTLITIATKIQSSETNDKIISKGARINGMRSFITTFNKIVVQGEGSFI